MVLVLFLFVFYACMETTSLTIPFKIYICMVIWRLVMPCYKVVLYFGPTTYKICGMNILEILGRRGININIMSTLIII